MKPKILIVDDLKDIVATMSRYFSMHGFDVDFASEKEEAEAMIEANSYSLVITDLQLTPVHSNEGLEIARLIHHEAPSTKIIILSAYGTGEVEREAERLGVSFFMRKPVPLSLLREAVEQTLRR